MIVAALLLAVQAASTAPTVSETAATCRALVGAPESAGRELERIFRDGGHSPAEARRLQRDCLLYIAGARDALRRRR